MPGIFRVQQLHALDFIGCGHRYESTTRNIPELGIWPGIPLTEDQPKRVSQQFLTDCGSTALYLTLALSNFRFRPNCWLTLAALSIRSRSEIYPCNLGHQIIRAL